MRYLQTMFTSHNFGVYWSATVVEANVFIILHLLGALALGLLVGYERSYHGRAAGMRTYGLVCMAAAALTVVGGYSKFWYGGASVSLFTNGDLSRVMQGILTGIGFLCAGVIMKEGFTISGLTTAASIWVSSVIGMMVGVGLYPAAMALAVLSALWMVGGSKLEAWLPSRQAVAITLRFRPGYVPVEASLRDMATQRGYDIADGSITISMDQDGFVWNFVAVARSRHKMAPLSQLGQELGRHDGVQSFRIGFARN